MLQHLTLNVAPFQLIGSLLLDWVLEAANTTDPSPNTWQMQFISDSSKLNKMMFFGWVLYSTPTGGTLLVS
jgi:hypothetical protein